MVISWAAVNRLSAVMAAPATLFAVGVMLALVSATVPPVIGVAAIDRSSVAAFAAVVAGFTATTANDRMMPRKPGVTRPHTPAASDGRSSGMDNVCATFVALPEGTAPSCTTGLPASSNATSMPAIGRAPLPDVRLTVWSSDA